MFRLLALSILALFWPSAGLAEIGVARLHVVDPVRHDPIAPDHRREWMVALYYPARAASDAEPQVYAPAPALIDALIAATYYDVPPERLRQWQSDAGPAIAGLPAAGRFPLITLSPGLGVAAFNYGMLASEIARRGFIVAVIDHPYVASSLLPDGRLMLAGDDPGNAVEDMAQWADRISDWARDVTVTLDRLGDEDALERIAPGLRIDTRHVIATGHSIGGTIALESCMTDQRIVACADFEGTPEGTRALAEGPSRPTLFVGSRSGRPDRPHVPPPLDQPPFDFLTRGRSPANWAVAIRGGSHMSYSDAPFVMPETLSRFGGELMTPERSFELYAGMVAAFARAYLREGREETFRAFLASAPEVRFSRSGEPGRPD